MNLLSLNRSDPQPMRPISASDLLEIWERGIDQAAPERALVILGALFPSASRQALAELTITQRDVALFQLRELTFGPRFKSLADCPACHEKLELAFDADDLRALGIFPPHGFALPDSGENRLPESAQPLRLAGYRIRFRQPTSIDLMKASRLEDMEQARSLLLAACIVSATYKGKALAVNELPAKVTETVIEHIGQAAGRANLSIAATCPACGNGWEIIFDIVSYFWSEINAWAARIMREVHLLAATYGWREADILAMSAWRRQRYLELIGA